MPRVGEAIRINLQLFDGATGKYPRAFVYKPNGSQVTGSPVALAHVANGLYENAALVMPDEVEVRAVIKVYNDALFSTLSSTHSDALEVYQREDEGSVNGSADLIGTIQTEDDLVGQLQTNDDASGVVQEC